MPDPIKPAPAEPVRTSLPDGQVYVRILKKGDGKVFTGETPDHRRAKSDQHDGSHFFPTYRFAQVVPMDAAIAKRQEDLGHVEIQP